MGRMTDSAEPFSDAWMLSAHPHYKTETFRSINYTPSFIRSITMDLKSEVCSLNFGLNVTENNNFDNRTSNAYGTSPATSCGLSLGLFSRPVTSTPRISL